MNKGNQVGPVFHLRQGYGGQADWPSVSKTKAGRSKSGPTRAIAIRNAHPRLRVPRAAVAKAITLLDAHFEILPGDLPHLSLPRDRLRFLKSQISDLKSASSSLSPPRLAAQKSKIENRAPSNRDKWRASSWDASRAASTPQQEKSRIWGACPPGELSLVFLTDPALAKIHADFMADPTATDVITFEGDATAGLAGEICVSADTAAKYVGARLVRAHGQAAFATELTLYLVHGWLHLAGYDDLRPAKKRRMRAAETRAMKVLAAHQAIPPFRLK